MNSTTVVRLLILVIPAVWIAVRLMPVDHPQYTNLRPLTQQEQEHQREPDLFTSKESLFQDHYQAHFSTSGFVYGHYRIAYKYGFDLALAPDRQTMNWASIQPLARQNWDERILGSWNQHQEAVLYGWEQGVMAMKGR
ncbi:MAG: hypothetical protein OEY86_04515 [Nitrospira sp.]|nr:hypothetical protein [Nitrospira sp.]